MSQERIQDDCVKYPPVLTKADFVRRYSLGEFGNHAPTWLTLYEYLKSGYTGLVHIRNRVAGGPTWYDTPHDKVEFAYHKLLYQGASDETLYFSGMAPTNKTTIQGELVQSIEHLSLYYSTVKKPMRDSLVEGGRQVYASTAICLLRRFMDPSSYEWVQVLLDRYPDHVVEFSCYSVCWGTIPRRNAVVWEVRKY